MTEPTTTDPATFLDAQAAIDAAFAESTDPARIEQAVCDELYARFDHYAWVGIYRVEGDDLVLGAWAGPEETEHTRIAVGEGICGLAAATGETEVVPDVSVRDEFIACFPSTRSEIVVPIHGPDGVLGEIDIDSDEVDPFDERDRTFLESLAERLAVGMVGA